MSKVEIDPPMQGQRRRFTAAQKRAILNEAVQPGESISKVARRYGLSPSMVFQWRRTMDDAADKSLRKNERVVPESEVKKLKARIRELERALGKQTMKVEILEEAVEIAREKKLLSRGNSSGGGGR